MKKNYKYQSNFVPVVLSSEVRLDKQGMYHAQTCDQLCPCLNPRQAELYSLDFQLAQEQTYAEETGLIVVAVMKDDQSGRKMDRDLLEEACRMLEADEADVLVTWKFDRLHRNYVNSVILRDRIRKAGKEIHYAQTRQVSG